jgi:hypothetical protein
MGRVFEKNGRHEPQALSGNLSGSLRCKAKAVNTKKNKLIVET